MSYSYLKQLKNLNAWKVYLNDEKHPILYYRRAICSLTYTQCLY